jgi:CheY-like chemotaxis protein
MQIYYFLYLCPEQTIILAMEIENQSVDYRPLILVAEDDDSNFKLIKAIIGKKCEVQWARNGEEIVSLFLENRDKADAILMDIKMPVMNGLDATQRIRREGGTLPIIMQTAYAFSSDRENAMNAGASEVLVKPIALSTLRNCLSSYLPQLVW